MNKTTNPVKFGIELFRISNSASKRAAGPLSQSFWSRLATGTIVCDPYSREYLKQGIHDFIRKQLHLPSTAKVPLWIVHFSENANRISIWSFVRCPNNNWLLCHAEATQL